MVPDLSTEQQDWLDIRAEPGGVASNLALCAHEANDLDVRVLAVTGDDDIGRLVSHRLQEAVPGLHTEHVPIKSTQTGVVILVYYDNAAEEPARTVLGPRHSAIDVVAYTDISDLLTRADDSPMRLILDGYALRLRTSEWIADFEHMRNSGIEIYLELLPHTIWKTISVDDLVLLTRYCRVVSTSLSTLAHIFSQAPGANNGHDPATQAAAVYELARRHGVPEKGSLTIRYGQRSAQYSLHLTTDEAPVLWRYDQCEYSRRKGNQDRLFLYEITGIANRLSRERMSLC